MGAFARLPFHIDYINTKSRIPQPLRRAQRGRGSQFENQSLAAINELGKSSEKTRFVTKIQAIRT